MHKRHRLTKDAEFKRVRSEGRSWAHPLLVLYAAPNRGEPTRVGISVSRRIGKAVTRNRVKRLLREAVRPRLAEIGPGWDLLLIARQPAGEASFDEVSAAVEQLLRRAGLGTASQQQ